MWWYDEKGEREWSDLMSIESRTSFTFRSNTLSNSKMLDISPSYMIDDVDEERDEDNEGVEKENVKPITDSSAGLIVIKEDTKES